MYLPVLSKRHSQRAGAELTFQSGILGKLLPVALVVQMVEDLAASISQQIGPSPVATAISAHPDTKAPDQAVLFNFLDWGVIMLLGLHSTLPVEQGGKAAFGLAFPKS